MPATAKPSVGPTPAPLSAPLFTYRIVVNTTLDFTKTSGGVYDSCYTVDKLKRATRNGKDLTAFNSNATVLCSNLRDAWLYCLTRINVLKKSAATYTFPNPSDRPTKCQIVFPNSTAPYQLRDSGDADIRKLGSF